MAGQLPLGVRGRCLWTASVNLTPRVVGNGCVEVSDESAQWFLSLIRVFSMYVISDFLDIISSQCKMCLFYTCELVNSIVVTEYYNILVR